MKKNQEKTKVIFRKYKDDGEIIAIFPEELGTDDHFSCLCYEHEGQHSYCMPEFVIAFTKLAKFEEYASLKTELENIGYNLDIKIKYFYNSAIKRFNKLEKQKESK
jgi:hypothetical protein